MVRSRECVLSPCSCLVSRPLRQRHVISFLVTASLGVSRHVFGVVPCRRVASCIVVCHFSPRCHVSHRAVSLLASRRLFSCVVPGSSRVSSCVSARVVIPSPLCVWCHASVASSLLVSFQASCRVMSCCALCGVFCHFASHIILIYDPALQAPPPQGMVPPAPPFLWGWVPPLYEWGVCVGVWRGALCFWMDPTHLGGTQPEAGIIYKSS